ncbi:hypothetical protein FA95DRAFT_1490875 [Auriscalpium vulgare]|uniref:Uncharacterized protein n=1 Tax=Auriscalpium vulgare TaxID=40419 RepID=A0ACB8RWT9_9AGAM|nr:hypothetical protein FA95DRAFT_1490875 [Auriscalpium vulgare]
MLSLRLPRPRLRPHPARRRRPYATAHGPVLVARAPLPPPAPPAATPAAQPAIDRAILDALARTPSSSTTALPILIQQYLDRAAHVLDAHLPYEPTPSSARRVSFHIDGRTDSGIYAVAHVAREGDRSKITLASGFAIDAGQPVVVSCAHTLEEIRWSPLLVLPSANSPLSPPDLPRARSSATLLLTPSSHASSAPRAFPVSSVLSSLHRSDLLLLEPSAPDSLHTLPVSPYPAHPGTRIRAHFVTDAPPKDDEGWAPWLGGLYAKWVPGQVLGYRDMAGREAQPGTYDALSHMLFRPPPLAGSSGGPIVDEESGAVVGVMLGTRMDNRVEGVRGWGVPAEAIFEVHHLPQLCQR